MAAALIQNDKVARTEIDVSLCLLLNSYRVVLAKNECRQILFLN